MNQSHFVYGLMSSDLYKSQLKTSGIVYNELNGVESSIKKTVLEVICDMNLYDSQRSIDRLIDSLNVLVLL